MNVAIYLAATCMVVAEMIKPTEQNICGQTTCNQRSLVLSECHEFVIPSMAAKTYGGADRSKVVVCSYPRVATMVGKKFVKDAAVLSPSCMNHTIYRIGSVTASLNPVKAPTEACLSSSFASSAIRRIARVRSVGDSHLVV